MKPTRPYSPPRLLELLFTPGTLLCTSATNEAYERDTINI